MRIAMSDKQRFDNEIRALEAQLGNIGTHLALDGAAGIGGGIAGGALAAFGGSAPW